MEGVAIRTEVPAAADPCSLGAGAGGSAPSSSKGRPCELCGAGAALLCAADEAYLCWDCDATVHGANFLVARHTRSVLCQGCTGETVRFATGDHPKPVTWFCTACQPQECGVAPFAAEVKVEGDQDCLVREQRPEEQCEVSLACHQGETVGEEEDCCASEDRSLRSRKKRSLCHAESTCMSPQSVLSCSPSPSNSTKKEEVQDSEEITKQVSMSQKRCCTPPTTHDQEESSSYPPTYRTARSKRRRCQQASGGSRWQDHSQEEGSSGDESRIERLLSKWHWDLGFSSPRVISLAVHIYRSGSRALRSSQSSGDTTRQTLAASLWLAAKLDDEQSTIPGATEMGVCTGVSARRLVAAEVQLLQMSDWNTLQGILG